MYYLLLIVLYPLSLLPLRILYVLSDLFYLVVFHLAGYRKQVVWDNLRHAFPEKSEAELKRIRRAFYRNFCDQWIETIKLLSISRAALDKRMPGNWEVLRALNDKGKSSYLLLGHAFNWEWGNVAMQYNIPQQFAGVYMPVKSQAMNRIMDRVRTRGGGWMISMKARKGFQRLQGITYAVGLIADQNPSNMNGAIWLPFMHREAPFFNGPEQLATRAKAAVVYVEITRVKRGYYNLHLNQLTDDAGTLPKGAITQQYVTLLEQQLRKQPENWMWTHKRWKYTRSEQ